ncbi:CocE/NonD family hydrolase [Actinomadura sp. LD22]|uniref:CocE/NonD family hydrolase n=1 Tax=Actinomadura physcomitrii TaxID=2650748 RepID=A0A6I4M8V8_9ACTN|nr:CocE/NonD family hydrolase [Actinomadura physcomitrii]MWA00694.1 CocE/NonD family hydrolase [Actinomadura physcomitrii]
MRRLAAVCSLMLLLAALTVPASAAPAPAAPYGIAVKRNLTLRLKDGTLLRADLHMPTDRKTGKPARGPFPVIVGFTPYGKTVSAGLDSAGLGPAGIGGLNPYLVERGYLGLVVDVPGTGGSQGKFDLFEPAEAQAGAQIVNWAARLPNSSGKVGMLGLSYLAIDQLFTAAAVGPHSPLKAIFPMAASADPYRDLFVSGGALNVESPIGLVFGYGVTRVATPLLELPEDPAAALALSYQHLLQAGPFELTIARDMLTNGPRRYDNAWWKQRAPENVLRKIVANGVAVYLVGGLYDVFQRGEPLLYSGLQNAAAGRPVTAPMAPGQPASDKYQLLYGPWTHIGMGTGQDLNALQLNWFDHWLKGRGTVSTRTPLHVVEPGGRRYDTTGYPLAQARPTRMYLRSQGRLTSTAPTGAEPADSLAFTGLSSPCSRSTDQFAAGLLSEVSAAAHIALPCTGSQQKPVKGPGETTYTSPSLSAPLKLAGPIGVTLRAASTRPETLFALTLEDVAPDGTSTDLSGGALLGSMRAVDGKRSWKGAPGGWVYPYHPLTRAAKSPVTPGKLTRYDLQVRPVFATVPAGHRLRVRVATADFPHLIPLADLPSLFGGRYTLHHDAAAVSSIDLSVLP